MQQFEANRRAGSISTESGSDDLSNLIASFDDQQVFASKIEQHTIVELRRGIERLASAISEISLGKLDSLLDEIADGVSRRQVGPNKTQQARLSLFIKLLATNRYFNEVLLKRKDDPGFISVDPLFRRTQEISELVFVLRQVLVGQNLKDNSAYFEHSLNEARRLSKSIEPLQVDGKIEAALALKLFENHAAAMLAHPLMSRKSVDAEDLGEFRKHIRRLTLFTRISLLAGSSPQVAKVHSRLQAVARDLKPYTGFEATGGATASRNLISIDEKLRSRTRAVIVEALGLISDIRILSAKGAPYAGLNHERYIGLLGRLQPKGAARIWGVEYAYNLAKAAHKGVYRMGGLERYFDHVRGVSVILMLEANISDPDVHTTALLHDVKEDTAVLGNARIFGEEESRKSAHMLLTKFYNRRVADGILCVTKRDKTGDPERDRANIQTYLHGLDHGGDIALLVKMADRLYNLRTLPLDNPKFTLRQLHETISEYLPIFARYLERASPQYRRGAHKMYDLILEALAIASANYPEHVEELWGAAS